MGDTFCQEAPDLSAVVAQFYPQSLDAKLVEIDAQDTRARNHCYAVLEFDGQGGPQTVVAAYANVYFGAVRVLRKGGNGFEVATDSIDDSLAGRACEAEAIDVDNDGTREAHVSFELGRNRADWIYAWRGGALINLTPTSIISAANEHDTLAYNAVFV